MKSERPFSIEPKAYTTHTQAKRRKVPDTKNSHTAHTNVSLTSPSHRLNTHAHINTYTCVHAHTHMRTHISQISSSGNCQETETCTVLACHTPRQLLQNHPSGHLGWWAKPRSAEKMLDGHQRLEVPAHARTAFITMASCRKDRKRISAESSLMPPPHPHPHDLIGQGTELNRS